MPTLTAVDNGDFWTNTRPKINTLITLNNDIVAGLTFVNATLLNSFTNVAGAPLAGYALSPNGILYLRGLVTGGAVNTVILTLPNSPTNYRPAALYRYATVTAGAFGWIEVQADGDVLLGSTSSSGNAVSLTSPGIKIV